LDPAAPFFIFAEVLITTTSRCAVAIMIVQPQRQQWATPEDFEKWQSTIIKLYIEEDRGLKEVSEIMDKEHGFQAT
jgi:hypothetical protein